ncbi:MAG: epoxyqueuosine reductase [Parasporobacterium sp.]|nr:epoxyqueuosine reductase [Parasporobacterium sp.]
MNLTETIKKLAMEHGMALVGIAPISRFSNVPDGRKPEVILPGCKSVVVFGQAVPKGVIAVKKAVLDGTAKSDALDSIYGRYGRNGISTIELMAVSYTLATYLERTANAPSMPMMVGSWAFGRPFSLRHAAVAAGLGKFGINKAVITEKYGPRIRWGAILTQAELDYDEMLPDALCLCAGREACGKCLSVCPTNALKSENMISFDMDGHQVSYIDVDLMACKVGCMDLETAPHPTVEEVQAEIDRKGYDPGDMLIPPTWKCDRCLINCPPGER